MDRISGTRCQPCSSCVCCCDERPAVRCAKRWVKKTGRKAFFIVISLFIVIICLCLYLILKYRLWLDVNWFRLIFNTFSELLDCLWTITLAFKRLMNIVVSFFLLSLLLVFLIFLKSWTIWFCNDNYSDTMIR